MKLTVMLICLTFLLGCKRDSADTVLETRKPAANDPKPIITNQFGMTFHLVNVDQLNATPKHVKRYPRQSFYFQRTELTYEQFKAYEKFIERGMNEQTAFRNELHYPSEWREVHDLAAAMSKADPWFDYRLPTHEEWAFVCMNGYDEDCPGRGPRSTADPAKYPANKFGIEGLMNYDVECGDQPGLFFGTYDRIPGGPAPPCRCHQFAYGNPDADDGLNELITPRFVLVPK